MRIYLIGYMGSGKSSAGKSLANKLSYKFFDIDNIFETKFHISIVDFYEKYGEPLFRKLENQILKDTLKLEDSVIATGGGTPCNNKNIELINSNGISFYLKLSAKSLTSRLLDSKKKRPIIMNTSEDKLYEKIVKQLDERESFYLKAHYIIKGENLDLNKIVELVKKHKYFI